MRDSKTSIRRWRNRKTEKVKQRDKRLIQRETMAERRSNESLTVTRRRGTERFGESETSSRRANDKETRMWETRDQGAEKKCLIDDGTAS